MRRLRLARRLLKYYLRLRYINNTREFLHNYDFIIVIVVRR